MSAKRTVRRKKKGKMGTIERTREAVMSLKTCRSIQIKIEYMADIDGRSVSNLLERILQKEIKAYEKKHGRIPITRP